MQRTSSGCLRFLPSVLVFGLASLVISMFFPVEWLFAVPFYLVGGWIPYLVCTLPAVTWNWEAIASGVVYLVLSLGGFHLVVRSIVTSRGMAWKWRWSACIATLFLLIFGVSLAIGGIVHQAVWLAQADRWWGGSSYSRSYITKQISNARQLLLSVRLFAADEGGRYPSRLEELLLSGSLEGLKEFERLTIFSGEPNTSPQMWIYVRGMSDSAPGNLPLIIAPYTYKGGKRIIGTNDTSVELMSPSSIRKQFPEWKAGYAALGIPLPPVLAEYESEKSPPAK